MSPTTLELGGLKQESNGGQSLGPRAALLVQAGLAGPLGEPGWAPHLCGALAGTTGLSLVHLVSHPPGQSWQSRGPRGIVQRNSVAPAAFWWPEKITGELKLEGWGDERGCRGQGYREGWTVAVTVPSIHQGAYWEDL